MKFIGMERDEAYFNIAQMRITGTITAANDNQRQGSLL